MQHQTLHKPYNSVQFTSIQFPYSSGLLWVALGCSGLLLATLGCSGLLCATPGKPVVQTHTWMYWGHMWHPWHLWHPWGPQGMQMYTYTCGWAQELPEKVYEDGFSSSFACGGDCIS